ncbi:MAG TPA: hypothetical protein VGL19_07560 [Polyangiaceae bacterium]
MTRSRGALFLLTCALACSSSPFRGGYALRDTALPGTKTLSAFVPGACQDAAHADMAPDFSSLELVETSTGRPLLLEHRPGYELLVAQNFFDDGPFLVFELIIKSDNLLRRWRIPRTPSATGSLEIGRVLSLSEARTGDGFEAGLASTRLECSLVPKASDLPLRSTNPAP